MNWFTWRQQRKQYLVFGVLLAAFTVFAILTGNHYWHIYQHAKAACVQNPANPSCSDLSSSLPPSYSASMRVVYLAGLAIPLVLGLFMGSPLISREYEDGTNKLAWTQSVSRRKWLTTKIIWTLLFAALYGVALSLLVSWWARTTNALEHSRFGAGQFDAQGLMPFAHAIFFAAIGFMASAWFRKTLIALVVTLGLFIAFEVTFAQWIRGHYMTPITITAAMGPNEISGKIPTGAWVLVHEVVDKNGKVFSSFDINNWPADCRQLIQEVKSGNGTAIKAVGGNGKGQDPVDACLNNHGYHQLATYQPAYRYWDFQRIEAGIYLGLTTLAVAGTYAFVLKRDA